MHKLYFYFRQWRSGGEESFHSLSRKAMNWDQVFSNEIIIVNVGIGNPVTIGYGFIEAALAEIRQRDEASSAKAQQRIQVFSKR